MHIRQGVLVRWCTQHASVDCKCDVVPKQEINLPCQTNDAEPIAEKLALEEIFLLISRLDS